MKRIVATLTAMALLFCLCGCSGKDKPKDTASDTSVVTQPAGENVVTVGAMYNASGISIADLMMQNEAGKLNTKYLIKLYKSADEVSAAAASGEIQIAMLPSKSAFLLFNNEAGAFKLLAFNITGNLYARSATEISAITDFDGKKVCVLGDDETNYLNALLKKNNITAKITMVETAFKFQIAAQENNYDILVSAEPYNSAITGYSASYKNSLNLEALWEKAYENSKITNGCVLVNKEFALTNAKLIDEFTKDYKNSVSACEKADDAMLQFICDYGMCATLEEAKAAVKNCGVSFVSDKEAVDSYVNLFGSELGISAESATNILLTK